MTTIKLNTDLEVKGCLSCPFCTSWDELDYGEITGTVNYMCGLINDANDAYICEANYGCYDFTNSKDFDNERLDNCPIISIEKED